MVCLCSRTADSFRDALVMQTVVSDAHFHAIYPYVTCISWSSYPELYTTKHANNSGSSTDTRNQMRIISGNLEIAVKIDSNVYFHN